MARRRLYEYTLTVRPHRSRYGGKGRTTRVVVVAGSQFDAEWAYKHEHPRMKVLKAVRGREVYD